MKNYISAYFFPYGEKFIITVEQPFHVRITVYVQFFDRHNGREIRAPRTEQSGAIMVVVHVRNQHMPDIAHIQTVLPKV